MLLDESQKYDNMITNFLDKIKEKDKKDKWSSAQIFELIYNLYCSNDVENGLLNYMCIHTTRKSITTSTENDFYIKGN